MTTMIQLLCTIVVLCLLICINGVTAQEQQANNNNVNNKLRARIRRDTPRTAADNNKSFEEIDFDFEGDSVIETGGGGGGRDDEEILRVAEDTGGDGGVVGSLLSCEWNEKETDLTLLTGNTAGDIRWEIISVEEGESILTQLGLENWELYQTRECLPQSPYLLLIKNFRGNGLSGGGYTLTVDGQVVDESYENEAFSIKVIQF